MKKVNPKNIKNFRYHILGAGILILNSIRHKLEGYRTPRTFSIHEIDRAVDYDFNSVVGWIKDFSAYSKMTIKDKIILELGPGEDLGIGLILLAMGAKKYVALDVNELAKNVPSKFYDKLFERIKDEFPDCNIKYLKEQLDQSLKGEESDLTYMVDKNFQISKIKQKFDIVFSQAAFEHFSNIEGVIQDISNVTKKGGSQIVAIDLSTHTRWIRDRDPLNIYRYSDGFWDLLKFSGQPNRIRVEQYKNLLKKMVGKK